MSDNDKKKAMEQFLKDADPELIERYGNPLDENDPRHWQPSEREERGISLADRVRLLELDMDLQLMTSAKVLEWMVRQEQEKLLEQLKSDPEGAIRRLLGKEPTRSFGPEGSDHAYAGSTKGIAPDTIVDTVDGPIRADQIPGYRNDPDWRPSPDWAEANCTCDAHVAAREANKNNGPTGFYL